MTRRCAGACERLLTGFRFIGPLPLGWARAHACERCQACYCRDRYHRRYIRTKTRRGSDVIEDVAELAGWGATRAQAAERLRMTWGAIERAHQRHGVAVPIPPDNPKFISRKAT